jgi:hypothetical protein
MITRSGTAHDIRHAPFRTGLVVTGVITGHAAWAADRHGAAGAFLLPELGRPGSGRASVISATCIKI